MKNVKTDYDLKVEVENWVNRTFNFIQLDVAEKMADNCLFEYIRPIEGDEEEFLKENSLSKEIDLCREWEEYQKENPEDSIEDFIEYEYENEFEEWKQELNNDNYPMWNTLFEVQNSYNEDLLDYAESVGCGVIEGVEGFNGMIFMRSCGHSFYSAYWIPMYLAWNEFAREQYKGIDYKGM